MLAISKQLAGCEGNISSTSALLARELAKSQKSKDVRDRPWQVFCSKSILRGDVRGMI